MPPLEVTSADVQRAVNEFKAIEQRVENRMRSVTIAEGTRTYDSAVARVAAMFGIKLTDVRAKRK